MSTSREPTGSKPAKVYLIRRLIVLLVFLLLVAVVVTVIVKPGSSSSYQNASNVDLPSDLAAETEQTTKQSSDASEIATCLAGQLAVTPVTDADSYAEGQMPQLSMSVVNTGGEACTADLGTAGMEYTVSSGSDEVWRSLDCQTEASSFLVIIDPDQVLEVEPLEWDRTRSSAESCDISRDAVAGGGASYHLRVTAAGVNGSGTAQFLLN